MFRNIFCIFLLLFVSFNIGSTFEIQPRIVNGYLSERGQFPFFVHLELKKLKKTVTCGGTLISANHILTAAHCLRNATKAAVHLGMLHRNHYEEGRQIIYVTYKNFHIHPHHDGHLGDDIALIELRRPVVFSPYIQPISFPNICDIPVGTLLTAIGNGREKDGKLAETLRYTTLKTITHLECNAYYQGGETVFCAEGLDNDKGVCQGDSGGPIINSIDNTLYGVISFTGSDNCTEFAQGFTNILRYDSWLLKATGIDFNICKIDKNRMVFLDFDREDLSNTYS